MFLTGVRLQVFRDKHFVCHQSIYNADSCTWFFFLLPCSLHYPQTTHLTLREQHQIQENNSVSWSFNHLLLSTRSLREWQYCSTTCDNVPCVMLYFVPYEVNGNVQHNTQKLLNRHLVKTLSTFFCCHQCPNWCFYNYLKFVLMASKFSVITLVIFPTENILILKMNNL